MRRLLDTGIIKESLSPPEPLTDMRKPNFGSLVENEDDEEELLMSAKTYLGIADAGIADRPGSFEQEDAAMPFANERAGTIKYKTNPQVRSMKIKGTVSRKSAYSIICECQPCW